jgi:uncharacterized protein (DUF111 family)
LPGTGTLGLRTLKAERVSKNRRHLEVKLTAASEIDGTLLGWGRP